MALKGSPQLKARMKAIRLAFKPVGRDWGNETVRLAQRRVRKRTGATARSIRVASATQRRAIVSAGGGARFLEGGTKAHDEKPRKKRAMKFGSGGNTIFAKKVHKPPTGAQPFLKDSARQALRDTPLARDLIEQWNKAA